jgi:hypothetical protein
MTADLLSNVRIDDAILEMKLKAGVETDTALAEFLGKAQSTVAAWRRRGRIPQAAAIRFELKLRASESAAA